MNKFDFGFHQEKTIWYFPSPSPTRPNRFTWGTTIEQLKPIKQKEELPANFGIVYAR